MYPRRSSVKAISRMTTRDAAQEVAPSPDVDDEDEGRVGCNPGSRTGTTTRT